MKKKIVKHWPLLLALSVFLLALFRLITAVLATNEGLLGYTLDDAYIHMAMAKNFAQEGVWGVTADDFSSSSSSLLWTLILTATYLAGGVNDIAPLILGALFATGSLLLVYIFLRRQDASGSLIFLALLLLIVATPLAPLVLMGMEHSLHILAVVALVFLAATVLEQGDRGKMTPAAITLLVVAPLAVMARYESLFILPPLLVLLVWRRRWLYATVLMLLSLAPVGIYGLISKLNGSFWLPNSLVMKQNTLPAGSLADLVKLLSGYVAYQRLLDFIPLLLLTLAVVGMFATNLYRRRSLWEPCQLMAVMFIFMVFIHAQLSRMDQFFRYEAYLITLGIFVGASQLATLLPRWQPGHDGRREAFIKYAALALPVLMILPPLLQRGKLAYRIAPQAAGNIHQQQYQMSRFLATYYQGRGVAANDVGAINYYADINCFDLWGLGDEEMTRFWKSGDISAAGADALTRAAGVEIAIAYDSWIAREGQYIKPDSWEVVGQWKIPGNVACSSDTVTFYAVGSERVPELATNLRDFSASLPAGVVESGLYLDYKEGEASEPPSP